MGNAVLAELARAILDEKEQPRASEHRATVRRVGQDGTYWVAIPGGADETPISSALVEAEPGDTVVVSISKGKAVMTGNATSPVATTKTVGVVSLVAETAADKAVQADIAAQSALDSATVARDSAAQAVADAAAISELLDGVEEVAEEADKTVAQILVDGETAGASAAAALAAAASALDSATSALNSANAASYNLSEVERVVGTLNWISEHGTYTAATETSPVSGRIYYTRSGSGTDLDPYVYTMVESIPFTYALTEDQSIVSGKTYYTRSGSGTSGDPYVYTPVETPDVSEISTYYERIPGNPYALGYYYLVVDESVQNYLASHLSQTTYGLDLMVDDSDFHMHIGTVNGSNTMGTYIVDASNNIIAAFTSLGAVIGKRSGYHTEITADGIQLGYGTKTPFEVTTRAFRAVSSTESKTKLVELPQSQAEYPFWLNFAFTDNDHAVKVFESGGYTTWANNVLAAADYNDGEAPLAIAVDDEKDFTASLPSGMTISRDEYGVVGGGIECIYRLTVEWTQEISDAITAALASSTVVPAADEYVAVGINIDYDLATLVDAGGSGASLAMRVGGRGTLPTYKYAEKPAVADVPAAPSVVIVEDGSIYYFDGTNLVPLSGFELPLSVANGGTGSSVEKYVQLAGDTMTGALCIDSTTWGNAFVSKATNIDADGAAPAGWTSKCISGAADKDDFVFAYMEGAKDASNNVIAQMCAHRVVNDTELWNAIAARIDSSGNFTYGVGDAAAFRSAIDAAASGHTHSYLPLSGGTLTGDVSGTHFHGNSTGQGWIGGKDMGNVPYGCAHSPNQSAYWPIIGSKTYSGHSWNIGTIDNNVYLLGFYSDRTQNGYDWGHCVNAANGNVYIQHGKAFNHKTDVFTGSDTTGTVSLSESAANYNHMRIFFRVTVGSFTAYDSVDVYSPNKKTVMLGTSVKTSGSGSGDWTWFSKAVYINGTSITRSYEAHFTLTFSSKAIGCNNNSNYVYVCRVEAWNE